MPQQATRNKLAPTHGKAKGVVFLVSLLVGGLFLLAGFGIWYALNEGGSMNEEETRFAQYLSEKYGKEFIVENIETTGIGLGIEGYRQGEAYSKDDESLKFNVSHSTDVAPGHNEYSDTYLHKLWSRDETSRLRGFLTATFTEAPDYEVEVSIPHDIQNAIRGRTPSIENIEEEYPNQISYRLIFRVQDGSFDTTEQRHYDDVYKLVEFLQGKSKLDARLDYVVYLSELRDSSAPRFECVLRQEDLSKIRDKDALEGCFTKRGVERVIQH